MRKLANTLRAFAEEKAGVKLTGVMHVYPWSFRHAAWLLTRYRVISGATSYEMMTDRKYAGKVVLWGEVVLFKDVASLKHKGEPVYKKGVWVGKSAWSDSHICLTRAGAVEARSSRSLPEQFDGQMLVACKGLPWQSSVQGILMRARFEARQRLAAPEEDAAGDEKVEDEARQIGEQVALGLHGRGGGDQTPALPQTARTPGMTPALFTPGLKTPVPRTPLPKVAKKPESAGEVADEQARTTSASMASGEYKRPARLPIPKAMQGEPAKNFMTEDPQESPKRQRIAEPDSKMPEMPFLKGSMKRELFAMPWEKDDEAASPKKRIKSVQEMFPGGDELEAEKILQGCQRHQ